MQFVFYLIHFFYSFYTGRNREYGRRRQDGGNRSHLARNDNLRRKQKRGNQPTTFKHYFDVEVLTSTEF
jgi:hypothetical protein